MRLAIALVVLVAALATVEAADKCPKGWESYPIKRGRITKSFDAGGNANFVAGAYYSWEMRGAAPRDPSH